MNPHRLRQLGDHVCVLEATLRNWNINSPGVVTDTWLSYRYAHKFPNEDTEQKRLAKLMKYFVFHASFLQHLCLQFTKTSLHPHPTLRNEIVQCCLNYHFSVQLNSCWRSSLLSENSPLPPFNPLRGSGERERDRETSTECWQGHNLPSLHTLFTVSLPAAIPSFLNGAIKNK